MTTAKKANPSPTPPPAAEEEVAEDLDKMMKEFNELHGHDEPALTASTPAAGAAPATTPALSLVPSPVPAASPATVIQAEPWLDESSDAAIGANDLSKELESLEESGSLAMTIQGNMSVHLKYEEAQEIILNFSEDGIRVRLADGIEFKIPAKRKR